MINFWHYVMGNDMNKNYPDRRSGHVAVTWKGVMYLWGGFNTMDFGGIAENKHCPKTIWKYFVNHDEWVKCVSVGNVPPPLLGSCSACLDGHLFIFGGVSHTGFENIVYSLDLKRLVWSKLKMKGAPPSKRNKLVSCAYNNKVIFFGGYGLCPTQENLQNGDYDQHNNNDRGWTNHLFGFEKGKNTWISLPNGGARPCSRTAHACAALNNKAYIFGGRHMENRLNDMYMLCLDNFLWTEIKPQTTLPVGRSWHSLSATSKDTLFMFGGMDTEENVLNDTWNFEASTASWKRISYPSEPSARLWHSASSGAYLGQVIVFGGCERSIFCANPFHCNKLVRFNTQPKTLVRICSEKLAVHKDIWNSKKDILPPHTYRCLTFMSSFGG